jgi:hypothetical protein
MKAKKLLLAVSVFGSSLLAHAGVPPTIPDAACSHVPPAVVAAINAVLTALGLPPIC